MLGMPPADPFKMTSALAQSTRSIQAPAYGPASAHWTTRIVLFPVPFYPKGHAAESWTKYRKREGRVPGLSQGSEAIHHTEERYTEQKTESRRKVEDREIPGSAKQEGRIAHQVYGWEEKKTKTSWGGSSVDHEKLAEAQIRAMTAADLNGFLVGCALVPDLYCPGTVPRRLCPKKPTSYGRLFATRSTSQKLVREC